MRVVNFNGPRLLGKTLQSGLTPHFLLHNHTEMKATDPPVIVQQTFAASSETVWSAITNHPEMLKWYFEELPAFKPEVGFETSFVIELDDRKFTHLWKVTEVNAGKSIKYAWEYEEHPGSAEVAFVVEELEDKTTLSVTVDVTEDFSEDIPEFERDSCIAGWEYFLGQQLAGYLS